MPYISIRQNGQDFGWRELDGPVVIGRQKECDICLIDMLLSRNHCRIDPAADGWVLVDLESKNGTWHDETQVERMELTSGTRVRVGRTTLTFHPGTPPAEGRYVSKSSNRPSDPHEALAGTVMGMVVVDDGPAERPADPWAARRAARPRPIPRPLGAGESGVYPVISENSVAVHEPSSGTCALLGESRAIDETRVIPDLSEELSVREPMAPPRTRVLPRPILLEMQVAAEQDERAAAASSTRESLEECRGTSRILEETRLLRTRRWYVRHPLSQEAVILLFAFSLLALFRFAINTSTPDTAVGQTVAALTEPSFDVGLMAATIADLPPLSLTATPQFEEPVISRAADADDAPPERASPVKALISGKRLKQSLNWDILRGVVIDYQQEVRRFILDVPSLSQTATTTATATTAAKDH